MAVANGTNPIFNTVRAKRKVIADSGATRTLKQGETGSVALFNRAAGIVYTLPAPVVGTWFEFIVTVSVTSNAYKIITDAATTFLLGSVIGVDTDSSNAVAVYTADGAADLAINMTAASSNAKGGLVGTRIRVTCISSTVWLVEGVVHAAGTVSSPVSTS